MERVKFSPSTWLLAGLFALTASMLASLVFSSGSAMAVVRGPYNTPEQNALNLCNGADRRGAIWISGPSAGYYDATVAINATENSVTVYIRGSVQNCNSTATGNTYANNVTPQGANSWRLTGLSTSSLFRGRSEGRNQWSTQGGQIQATLNVAGLAPSSPGVPGSQTINLDLYRCFSTQANRTTGTCYAETLTLTINRAALPRTYELAPTVSLGSSAVELGTEVRVNAAVNNTGTGPSSGAEWRFTRSVVASGQPIPSGGNSANEACIFYGSAVTDCDPATFSPSGATTSSGTGLVVAVGQRTFSTRYIAVEDYPAGTKVCVTLSLRSRSSSSTQWVHSVPACYTLAKRPKVQVLGGDLWVGRPTNTSSIVTSVTNKTTETYGSYSEYAIAASGTVTGMASGSGYADGTSRATLCQYSLLTFNNVVGSSCTDAAIGSYQQLSAAPPALTQRFPVSSSTPTLADTVTLSDLANGVYTRSSGTVTLNAATINAGRWYIINAPNADVVISGNLAYTANPLGSLADIPQVVIIARNILINESVTNVDAWLVAAGTGVNGVVNTCREVVATALTANRCAQQLVVNGPVIANHLVMNRTYGAGAGNQAGVPGEIFNFRPDAYLWLVNRAQQAGQLTTAAERELPPKY